MRQSGDTLTTTFAILEPECALKLRNQMKELAAKLGPAYQKDVQALAGELKSQGREKNLYTILFSYILDDLVWDQWDSDSLLESREFSIKKPFWTGVIWADYPPRDFSCGTNSLSDKGVSLKVNWSEVCIPKMKPFVADWANLGRMFDDLAASGQVTNAEARKVFAPFNLFDSEGKFTLPVIDARTDNALHRQCVALGRKVAAEFPQAAHPEALAKDFSLPGRNAALVIAYHEFMWELLGYYTQQGVITKPKAFADPQNAQAKDIGDLVFVVYN